MIRISKMADYAVVILVCLLHAQEETLSASLIAEKTKLPEPTASKILKLLVQGEIVKSTRGSNGGYSLAKDASDLNIADVIEAIDGPLSITSCCETNTGTKSVSANVNDCTHAGACLVRGRWDEVNHAIKTALKKLTLKDMSASSKNLFMKECL